MRMMHDTFLNRSAPLFGRAAKLLPVRPMSYLSFAEAVGDAPTARTTFEKFSLVKCAQVLGVRAPAGLGGGAFGAAVLRLRALLRRGAGAAPQGRGNPGQNPLSVLEAVGRGAAKPSEIAARLGTAQSNLTRIFEALVDAALLAREIPFGESSRTTKRVLYRIADLALRFHFFMYIPASPPLAHYDAEEKARLVATHVGPVFEAWYRAAHPGSGGRWEGPREFDVVPWRLGAVRPAHRERAKWGEVTKAERARLEERTALAWAASAPGKKYGPCEVEIVDSTLLKDAPRMKRLCNRPRGVGDALARGEHHERQS